MLKLTFSSKTFHTNFACKPSQACFDVSKAGKISSAHWHVLDWCWLLLCINMFTVRLTEQSDKDTTAVHRRMLD